MGAAAVQDGVQQVNRGFFNTRAGRVITGGSLAAVTTVALAVISSVGVAATITYPIFAAGALLIMGGMFISSSKLPANKTPESQDKPPAPPPNNTINAGTGRGEIISSTAQNSSDQGESSKITVVNALNFIDLNFEEDVTEQSDTDYRDKPSLEYPDNLIIKQFTAQGVNYVYTGDQWQLKECGVRGAFSPFTGDIHEKLEHADVIYIKDDSENNRTCRFKRKAMPAINNQQVLASDIKDIIETNFEYESNEGAPSDWEGLFVRSFMIDFEHVTYDDQKGWQKESVVNGEIVMEPFRGDVLESIRTSSSLRISDSQEERSYSFIIKDIED